MGDLAGNYNLKVEFLENNQLIDEEEEFRSFCSNILEPGNQAPPPATIPIASKHLPVKSSSAAEPPRQSTAVSVKAPSLAMATSIKRVKPAYVQTLRPETANVAEDDVRLSYAQLFFNTFNGFEKEDLGEKLRAYCVDDCSMSVKWIGERGNPCGPNYREVKGVYPVTTFLEAIMVTAVPDAVAQLQDSKLRVKPDRSSYLLCKYTFNGTQITKIDPAKRNAGPALDIRSMMGEVAGNTTSTSTSTGSNTHNSNTNGSNSGAHTNNTSNSNMHSDNVHSNTSTNDASNSGVEPSAKRLRTGADSKANLNSDTSSVSSGGKGPVSKTRGKRSADGLEEAPIIETVPMAATELLPVSMKMSIVGTLIIHINAEKRIFKFEYIQKVIRLN